MENDNILDEGIALPKRPSIVNAKEIIKLRRDYKEQFNKVKNGRYAIVGLIIILGIAGIYEVVTSNFNIYAICLNGAVLAGLIGTYFYSLKEPYLAFIIALIALLALTALTGLADPINLIKGILWKGVIIYFLIVGLSPANNLKSTVTALLSYGVDVNKTQV